MGDAAAMTKDFMRQIIVKKVKQDFPAQFGRDPTDEELEIYVAKTMEAASAMFGGGGADATGLGDIAEAEFEESDDAYDPQRDLDDEENDDDVPNEEELADERQDIEKEQALEHQPAMDEDIDEEALVNSDAFKDDLAAALKHVTQQAQFDRDRVLQLARDAYIRDTGENPTDEMLQNALNMFAEVDESEQDEEEQNSADDDVEEEEQVVNPEEFKQEMESAMEAVRQLGKAHGDVLMTKISESFETLNGAPPTQEQLDGIKARIQQKFADEAREDFLDVIDSDHASDAADEEYKPSEDDKAQQAEDEKIDAMEEQVDEETAIAFADKPVKVLVTPVKKRRSGASMGVYMSEDKKTDTKKTLEFAQNKFEQINKRAPTDDDSERLKDFLTTGMLFESVMDAEKVICAEKIAEDDLQFRKDFASMDCDLVEPNKKENEDTSNMIDID